MTPNQVVEIFEAHQDDEQFCRHIFTALGQTDVGMLVDDGVIRRLDMGVCRSAQFQGFKDRFYIHFHVGEMGEVSEPRVRLRAVERWYSSDKHDDILPPSLHFPI